MSEGMGAKVHVLKAGSYTHLDVYKRQGIINLYQALGGGRE